MGHLIFKEVPDSLKQQPSNVDFACRVILSFLFNCVSIVCITVCFAECLLFISMDLMSFIHVLLTYVCILVL